LTSSYVK